MSEPFGLHGVEVEPLSVASYRYGLLSAAAVQPDSGRRWEIAGVTYPSDGCAQTGGIWLDPCYVEPLPDPTDTVAFTVALNRAAVTNAPIIATLTARDAGYGTMPVVVTVDGVPKNLATISATQSWAVSPGDTVTVTATIGAVGKYPPGSATVEFAVPADATGETETLTATVEVPPDYPTKDIPLGVEFITGRPFMVYEAMGCGVGLSEAEATQHAERRLVLHEQFRVEQRFTATALRGGDVVKPNGNTALPLDRAVGVLEQEIAARFGGIGTLHALRTLAAPLDHLGILEKVGDKLLSTLDNPWAFGAGYSTDGPDGVAAPANQAWIYATGPVVVRRSEIVTRTDFSTARNIRMALAERAYVFTADCLRLAVLAILPGSP